MLLAQTEADKFVTLTFSVKLQELLKMLTLISRSPSRVCKYFLSRRLTEKLVTKRRNLTLLLFASRIRLLNTVDLLSKLAKNKKELAAIIKIL